MGKVARGSVVISDPWEFASMTGRAQLSGDVALLMADAVTLMLDLPVPVRGRTMTHAQVTPRHDGFSFARPCVDIPASITFMSDDPPAWYAAIGTLTLE